MLDVIKFESFKISKSARLWQMCDQERRSCLWDNAVHRCALNGSKNWITNLIRSSRWPCSTWSSSYIGIVNKDYWSCTGIVLRGCFILEPGKLIGFQYSLLFTFKTSQKFEFDIGIFWTCFGQCRNRLVQKSLVYCLSVCLAFQQN